MANLRSMKAHAVARLRDPGAEELLVIQGWQALSYQIRGAHREITILRWNNHSLNARRLTPREFETAHLAALGFAGKDAAQELSIAWATARSALKDALGKLDLHSGAQLPGFWHCLASDGRRLNLSNGMSKLVFESRMQSHGPTNSLTEAECDVLQGVINGYSNQEIAFRRSTSTRTVANQLAVLYEKLGALTRNELAAKALRVAAASSTHVDLPPVSIASSNKA